MPGYNNKFFESTYYDHIILDPEGKRVGTLRVKPSGVLWKAKGKQKFSGVTLDEFSEWICENPNAKLTTS